VSDSTPPSIRCSNDESLWTTQGSDGEYRGLDTDFEQNRRKDGCESVTASTGLLAG
jgi:hypothetical protein